MSRRPGAVGVYSSLVPYSLQTKLMQMGRLGEQGVFLFVWCTTLPVRTRISPMFCSCRIPRIIPLLAMILFLGLADMGRSQEATAVVKKVPNAEEGFVKMFDGKSTTGWKINENEKSWSVEDGALVCKGERSHIFYVADDKPFKNFHFKAEVKTMPNSNAGIYFHTKFQESGWPKYGFECQVNNSFTADPRKTSSLYAVKDVLESAAKDEEWYTQEIIVVGKTVTLKVNGKTQVEYTQPEDRKPGDDFERMLNGGTFALQAHDPGSTVYFRNLRVKRLD